MAGLKNGEKICRDVGTMFEEVVRVVLSVMDKWMALE